MKIKNLSLGLCAFLLVSSSALANRFSDVNIEVTYVAGNVYMLSGAGGNSGILVGKDGTLMIDDQFEPLAPKIEEAIKGLKLVNKDVNQKAQVFDSANFNPKVSYVVNTHYHGDHTGSNVYFSKSASLLAHENVRKRLAKKSSEGLPVITYEGGIKLHLNNEDVHVSHLAAGHTDGDSVVYFANANVWHLGDLLFNGLFPYVDTDGGGSVSGYIKNISSLLSKIDEQAIVIPGHGALTNKEGLKALLEMMIATKLEVHTQRAAGKSLEQVIEQGLSQKWQSWYWAFITEKKWISTLYKSN